MARTGRPTTLHRQEKPCALIFTKPQIGDITRSTKILSWKICVRPISESTPYRPRLSRVPSRFPRICFDDIQPSRETQLNR